MSKKTQPQSENEPAGRNINFRASPNLAARLDTVAEALNLDISNLVRMVLSEHLAEYEDRAAKLRRPTKES